MTRVAPPHHKKKKKTCIGNLKQTNKKKIKFDTGYQSLEADNTSSVTQVRTLCHRYCPLF